MSYRPQLDRLSGTHPLSTCEQLAQTAFTNSAMTTDMAHSSTSLWIFRAVGAGAWLRSEQGWVGRGGAQHSALSSDGALLCRLLDLYREVRPAQPAGPTSSCLLVGKVLRSTPLNLRSTTPRCWDHVPTRRSAPSRSSSERHGTGSYTARTRGAAGAGWAGRRLRSAGAPL